MLFHDPQLACQLFWRKQWTNASKNVQHVGLLLALQTQDHQAVICIWAIGTNICKISIECNHGALLALAYGRYFRIRDAPHTLIENSHRVVPGLSYYGRCLDRQVFIDLKFHTLCRDSPYAFSG